MSRRKLMIVIPGMDMGGAELQLIKQITLFPEFDITLVVLSDRHLLLPKTHLPKEKIKVYGKPALRYLNTQGIFAAIPVAWQMMKHCRRENINCTIAHLPMAHWTARWMVVFSCLTFYRVRLIVYHRSEQYKTMLVYGFNQKVFTLFQSLLAYLTDTGNIFISKAAKADVSQNQYVREATVIKNVVEESENNLAPANDMLASQKKVFRKYIVIPGRIERVKGQLFFIKSLTTELIEKIKSTNTLVVFAGGGSDEQELTRLIPGGLKQNVLITQILDHAVLLSFLSLADLVIIPSLSEGLGNTLIESMMLKRNVVSSTAGGLQETIHDSNAVEWFNAGDADHLQQKMRAWFAEELSFQPEKAYEYYLTTFSPKVHREAMLQYLNRILLI